MPHGSILLWQRAQAGTTMSRDLFLEGELASFFFSKGGAPGVVGGGEEAFAEPHATVDGVGFRAITAREQTAAAGGLGTAPRAGMRAVYVRNAVMLGQRIVEHGVRLYKIKRTEVVSENVLARRRFPP